MNYYSLTNEGRKLRSVWWPDIDPVALAKLDICEFTRCKKSKFKGAVPIKLYRNKRRTDIFISGGIIFCNKKAIQIIRTVAEKEIQICPCKLKGKEISVFIVNPLRSLDCLNLKKSEFILGPQPHRPKDLIVIRPVLKASKLKSADIFRVKKWSLSVVISERIKAKLTKAKISGVSFDKLEA